MTQKGMELNIILLQGFKFRFNIRSGSSIFYDELCLNYRNDDKKS